MNNPRYIVWDAETDTSTLTHRPNLIKVDVLKVDEFHNYRNSLLYKKTFEGYNCCDDFCNWLFSEENAYSTVLAHNGGGYDYKFVLSWRLKHSTRLGSDIV